VLRAIARFSHETGAGYWLESDRRNVSGAGFVLATSIVWAWNGRRRKAFVGERPPQREKLLRHAGYSLQCSINDLSEHWNFELAQALSAGVGLGLLISGVFPLIEGLVLKSPIFRKDR